MIVGASGRSYDPLPIDNTAGFPQSFPFLFGRARYQFAVYVDVPESALGPIGEVMTLPDPQRFLVVRVDATDSAGDAETVFLRKVVPSLEYRVRDMMLTFPQQVVARRNLNSAGNFGSAVLGGVAAA